MKNSDKVIQVTSGRGPAECCWVVARVLKQIIKETGQKKLKYEVITKEKGVENTTLQSASILISGESIEEFIQSWLGTIQWIGQSPYRKFHKRKNWFVGVNELNAYEQKDLNLKDVSFQTLRSGGPGGQHVNKVSTAVRATHIPLGISVLASETRSQVQNKKLATERLMKLVDETNLNILKGIEASTWNNHNQLERGNPVRVYSGMDFRRIK